MRNQFLSQVTMRGEIGLLCHTADNVFQNAILRSAFFKGIQNLSVWKHCEVKLILLGYIAGLTPLERID